MVLVPQIAGRWIATAALAAGLVTAARAELVIGQTAGITGPAAGSVKEVTQGAQLYFDAVNAAGGVHGQKLHLLSLDDKFDPKLAAANAKALIDKGAVALFLTRGTPHTQAVMPLLAEHRIPLVAPSTGAMVLHKPVNPWLFNVRASYQREAERVIEHLGSLGVTRVALVQVDDSFGDDAMTGALAGLAKAGQKPAAHEKFPRDKPDMAPVVSRVLAASPQAVLFVGTAEAVAQGMKAMRAGGSTAQLVTLSNNASAGFIQALGKVAHGVVVSQVFPPERSIAKSLIKDAQDSARKAQLELTPSMIEGYASAKVLVEGLKRAGPKVNRQALRDALDGMKQYDLGGLELGYSPSDHSGLQYVDLAILDETGKFRR